MNQSLKLSTTSAEVPAGHGSHERPPARAMDPYRFFRRRYLFCSLLILAGGVVGVYAGRQIGHLRYRSTGLVHIAPVLPGVMADQNDTVPAIDGYMKGQVSLIQSQQVCELAVHDRAWRALGRGDSDRDVKQLMDSLEVSHNAPNENIKVSCTDASPEAAMAGVQSVLAAYTKMSAAREAQGSTRRLQILQERATSLATEAKTIRQQIGVVAEKYGADDLTPLHQFRLQELNRLEAQLKALQQSRTVAESVCRQIKANTLSGDAIIRAIASVDPLMRQYVKDKSDVQRQMEELSTRLGGNHPLMIATQTSLDFLDRAIADYTEEYRNFVSSATFETPNGIAAAFSVDRLKQREDELRKLQAEELAESTELWRKSVEVRTLREQEAAVSRRAEETRKRIELIGLEAAGAGHIDIMSTGNRPIAPFRNAPVELASVGGLTGALIVFGLIVAFGMTDRRLRTTDEVRALAPTVPLLGSVPTLRNAADSEPAALAAKRIHQIRSVLQIHSAPQNQRVFVVTSPSAGDGKTCLTLALGISFAAANSRTLLIDYDLTGQGLSSRLRQLGPGIDQGMGLLDAMAGQPLDRCVAATEIAGLSVLPLGTATGHNVGQLSLDAIGRLINKARTMFDTVLIDTGPIAASPEASAAAAVADGVVLAIARGDQQPVAQQAIDQLRSINVRIAGIVYNRASQNDLKSAGSSSSRYAWHHRPIVRTSISIEQWEPLGPLALAVASYAAMEAVETAPLPARKAG